MIAMAAGIAAATAIRQRNRRPHDLAHGTLAEALRLIASLTRAPDCKKHCGEHAGGDENAYRSRESEFAGSLAVCSHVGARRASSR